MTPGAPFTCRDLIGFLDDYEANRLDQATRATFDAHLIICRHCREFLKTYRDTISLSRSAGGEPGTEMAMPEDLVKAIMAARKAAG